MLRRPRLAGTPVRHDRRRGDAALGARRSRLRRGADPRLPGSTRHRSRSAGSLVLDRLSMAIRRAGRPRQQSGCRRSGLAGALGERLGWAPAHAPRRVGIGDLRRRARCEHERNRRRQRHGRLRPHPLDTLGLDLGRMVDRRRHGNPRLLTTAARLEQPAGLEGDRGDPGDARHRGHPAGRRAARLPPGAGPGLLPLRVHSAPAADLGRLPLRDVRGCALHTAGSGDRRRGHARGGRALRARVAVGQCSPHVGLRGHGGCHRPRARIRGSGARPSRASVAREPRPARTGGPRARTHRGRPTAFRTAGLSGHLRGWAGPRDQQPPGSDPSERPSAAQTS
jgi:hypothetical protein